MSNSAESDTLEAVSDRRSCFWLSHRFPPADAASVSYDLFAQAFANGDGVRDPQIADVVLDVLRPFLVGSPDEKGFCHSERPTAVKPPSTWDSTATASWSTTSRQVRRRS
jgi:hypothetical protein